MDWADQHRGGEYHPQSACYPVTHVQLRLDPPFGFCIQIYPVK